jgi:hypothetical protein
MARALLDARARIERRAEMSVKGIQMLESVKAQGNADSQAAAQKDVERKIKEHETYVDKSFNDSMKEIADDKSGRDKQSGWTCMFAIFLGPLIGTAIGNAIGGAAAEGDKKSSDEAHKQAGLADLQEQHAMDEFQKSTSKLQDTKQDADDIAKFRRELNDQGWTGIT